MLGASHSQTNLLNYIGAMPLIFNFVDDDVLKINKWIPGDKPIPIVSGDILKQLKTKEGTVLLTGFGYPDWMSQVRKNLSNSNFQFLEFD